MAQGQIDLLSLFKQVSKSVKQNQGSLNQADSYNHDHGDHMVEIFDVVTQAVKEKKTAEPADQLEYAAQLLRKKTSSGSGTVYANGLEQAAKQVLGKNLDTGTIMTIIQALMGSAQKSGQVSSQASGQSVGGDLLGSLLGQVMGGAGSSKSSSADETNPGLDLSDLLGAGMNYMAAKQNGKSDIEAITGALVSGSSMAETPYRAQSGEVVTSALLGALGKMLNK